MSISLKHALFFPSCKCKHCNYGRKIWITRIMRYGVVLGGSQYLQSSYSMKSQRKHFNIFIYFLLNLSCHFSWINSLDYCYYRSVSSTNFISSVFENWRHFWFRRTIWSNQFITKLCSTMHYRWYKRNTFSWDL